MERNEGSHRETTMKYFELTTTAPLKYDICGNLRAADGFLHHKRRMDRHVLIVVLKGTLYLLVEGEQVAVTQGQYILLKAGEEHEGLKPSEGELSYLWVHFSAQTGDGEGAQSDHYRFPAAGQLPAAQRVTTLFRQLLDLSRTRGSNQGRMSDYCCSLLLMELTMECGRDGGQKEEDGIQPVIREAMDYLETNCHRQLETAAVAQHFHYNPEYFGSLFKKQTGMTFTQYLNRMRIDTAKRLLENQNISIKEAAYSSGFRDEKYFMKMFKQQEGMTPLAYRKAFNEAYVNHA